MIRQSDTLLEKLGYDTKSRNYAFLKDIVDEAVDDMNNHSEMEVKSHINDRNSYLYVESAHFYFEVGLNYFHEALNNLHDTKRPANKKVQRILFGEEANPTLEDTVFAVASYIVNSKKEEVTAKGSSGKALVLSLQN